MTTTPTRPLVSLFGEMAPAPRMRKIAATPGVIGMIVVPRARIANLRGVIMIEMSVVVPSRGAKH